MIARIWRGWARVASAADYCHHFTIDVAPRLKAIAGHRGAYLLRHEAQGQVEFLAMTLWDSIETVKKFTGEDPEVAVVAPEARVALTTCDDFAKNYDVVFAGIGEPQPPSDRSRK